MGLCMIKNPYLSKQYGVRRLLSEVPHKSWKLERIETSCSVRKTNQKGTDQLARFRMKLPFSVQVCTG